MHSDNPHHSGYDIEALVKALPELKPHVIEGKSSRLTVNFSDPSAVKLLNKALLIHNHGLIDWDIPKGYLCPPIPGRLDYLCYLNEFLTEQGIDTKSQPIRGLDIGTGANLIYPLLADRFLKWNMVASDIDGGAIESAKRNLKLNQSLNPKIEIRQQTHQDFIFKGVIKEGDHFNVTLCNPPFHGSKEEALAGSERKNKNLNHNKQKRKSNLKKIDRSDQLNFAGLANELWCDGGEKGFILNMIRESQSFKKQVNWFTCLVSKKETLSSLKNRLKKLNADVHIVEMSQGNKISRFIAWQFKD